MSNSMQINYEGSTSKKVVSHGLSMGSALAMIISYSANHSILWAIVHGIFSWFYVIYAAIMH